MALFMVKTPKNYAIPDLHWSEKITTDRIIFLKRLLLVAAFLSFNIVLDRNNSFSVSRYFINRTSWTRTKNPEADLRGLSINKSLIINPLLFRKPS